MKKMNRIAAAAALSALLVMSLTCCGQSGQQPDTSAKTEEAAAGESSVQPEEHEPEAAAAADAGAGQTAAAQTAGTDAAAQAAGTEAAAQTAGTEAAADTAATNAATAAEAVTAGTEAAAEIADTASTAAEIAAETQMPAPGIYINGQAVTFSEEGNTDLPLLTVEKGITVQAVKAGSEEISVNGQTVEDSVFLDIPSITSDDVLEFEITEGDTVTKHTVSLLPSTFPAYTTEGQGTTEGDYYLTSYDLENNYIFKLNNSGELIFYKKITRTEDGNEINTNALDFRKQYTPDGEVRYTYMPYLEGAFADGDCAGINPGALVIMDENYEVLDNVYYIDENGENVLIEPHGSIWLDDGHYILAAYKRETVDVPEDLGAENNTADLAVLYIEEIKDGEVLWEFNSADHDEFLYQCGIVPWASSMQQCYDYVHFNSMSIDKDDNLVVSLRHQHTIIKISRTDGSLMWQLGGNGDEFGLTDEQKFSYQHSIIVTDDGSYMLFDNANTAENNGTAEFSSVVRLKVDEQNKTVTEFKRYNVVDFFSNYMGAIRELDSEKAVYLWSVGGNYETDTKEPPMWSMVEYTENGDEGIQYNFCFRFDNAPRRLYCANKCK